MPEIILIIVFITSLLIIKGSKGTLEIARAARIGMAAMLVVTGIAHFAFTKGMTMMLPPFIPQKELIIYITGILEFAAAAGILLPGFRVITGWLLITFFILLLPANIYAALNHINLKTAGYDGDGPAYLWFRIPLQLFFIAWVYLSVISNRKIRFKKPVMA
ncbi:MAG: hypothetical protein WC756_14550 [Taibaiella sp.]|jgi:uncharacterized membrane protein